jgi:hypothetical protein
MFNFKKKVMKKVILFFVVALAFASCGHKAAETAPKADSLAVDSTVVVDSVAVDTTKVDSVAK